MTVHFTSYIFLWSSSPTVSFFLEFEMSSDFIARWREKERLAWVWSSLYTFCWAKSCTGVEFYIRIPWSNGNGKTSHWKEGQGFTQSGIFWHRTSCRIPLVLELSTSNPKYTALTITLLRLAHPVQYIVSKTGNPPESVCGFLDNYGNPRVVTVKRIFFTCLQQAFCLSIITFHIWPTSVVSKPLAFNNPSAPYLMKLKINKMTLLCETHVIFVFPL